MMTGRHIQKVPGVATVFAALALLWLALPVSSGDASLSPAVQPPTHRLQVLARPTPDVHSAFVAVTHRDFARQNALAVLHDDLWLHAVGAQLYTAWNAPATLKAINWYGFEYAPFVPGGLDHAPLDSILASLHALGFNALRITFADQTVESNPIVTRGLAANPSLRGLHSLDILQRIIERAHTFGLRVILCNSRSEAGRGPELKSGLWFTKRYPTSAWVDDWLTLARRFRNLSSFVGADLRNEPHITGNVFDEQTYFTLGPLWGAYHGTYYHERDWHYAAETMGNALLAIDPHLLIIVEGVQMYLDPYRNVMTGGLWGANLVGVQYDPIVLSRPGQLVYSIHEYGPHMWQADWFNPHTTYASLARRWNHLWGYLLTASRQLRAPVLVGEFGTCHAYYACISSNQGWKQGFWFKSFVRYLSEHPQVGWAYWALNPDGPFQPTEVNAYSLATLDWRHYYPLVTYGLAPLLREPSGLWRTGTAKGPLLTPQPGCDGGSGCAGDPQAALSTILAVPRPRAPIPATALTMRRAVPYTAYPDPARSGTLYLPGGRGAAPRPAVVIVPGSGWDPAGGAAEAASLATTLAWHGYVTFDITHRLAGQGGDFPRDIRDVKSAVAYLADHASTLGIAPGKIGVIGFGAGGYLGMMAAYAPDAGQFAPKSALPGVPHVAAVAGIFAPSDLVRLAQRGSDAAELSGIAGYLHAPYQQNPGLYAVASPVTYADRGVPTILVDGMAEADAPFTQAYKLFRALKQRSIVSQLVDLPGAPRGLSDLAPGALRTMIRKLTSFFDTAFYHPAQPAN